MNNEISYLSGNRGVTEKIKRAMYDVARQFVYIGFLLWEVKEYEYFKEGGYKDVYDYAEKELGFKKSSTKNFIGISEKFGMRYENQSRGKLPIRTMNIQQEYEKFNYSQLCEMLSMSAEQIKKATPDMTVRQLREIKKKTESIIDFKTLDKIRAEEEKHEEGQTSGQSERWIKFRNRAPQKGKFPCKLVIHTIYMNGKPQKEIEFGLYKDEKWTDRRGNEILEVTHYSELPDFPE